jgi:hypothetical protein
VRTRSPPADEPGSGEPGSSPYDPPTCTVCSDARRCAERPDEYGGGTDHQERTVRKFLFNGAIISSLFSGVSLLKSLTAGPRDWRLLLTAVAWAATTAIAVGNVVEAANEDD